MKFMSPCTSCLEFFDAFESDWCDCIGSDISPKCTHCGKCFCRSALEFKSDFWKLAPRRLNEMRRRLLGLKPRASSDRFTSISKEGPAEIRRPLVLVVDDSKLIRMTTMRLLRDLGYETMEAADAEQALVLTDLYHPEAVISDALMPRVDGRDMCRTIKSSEDTRDTKVIIMTGLYKAPRYKYEAFHSYGVDDYLCKPINPHELQQTLLRLIGLPRVMQRRDFAFEVVA